MLNFLLYTTLVGLLVLYWVRRRRSRFWDIPSPKGLPIVGNTFMVDAPRFHQQLMEWSKECGPVFRFQIAHRQIFVANDFETIYKILVKRGKEFGGRPSSVRPNLIFQRTGILISIEPDKTWQNLRKISHQYLRQFGDGLTRLEHIINEVSDDMFQTFDDKRGTPFDPHQLIFNTALNTIAFLITGDRMQTGHPIVEKMRYLENVGPDRISTTKPKYLLYELMPFMKYLRLQGWKEIEEIVSREKDVWGHIRKFVEENPNLENLTRVLLNHVDSPGSGGISIQDVDAEKTAISLLFAGVTTTSASFYAAVNILAHNKNTQMKINEEIHAAAGSSAVKLSHRPSMPYTQAFILELLRYTSVVPMGIPHRCLQDTELDGFFIPKNTRIFTNLWALHHDDEFWGDPFSFRPERFLDAKEQVVTADHPNRRHLMPFGAGTRVCLGESLALARLFLWLTSLVQRFCVTPAEGNDKWTTDPRKFALDAVLRVTRYSVVFDVR